MRRHESHKTCEKDTKGKKERIRITQECKRNKWKKNGRRKEKNRCYSHSFLFLLMQRLLNKHSYNLYKKDLDCIPDSFILGLNKCPIFLYASFDLHFSPFSSLLSLLPFCFLFSSFCSPALFSFVRRHSISTQHSRSLFTTLLT